MLSYVECNHDFCDEYERNGFKIDYGYQHNWISSRREDSEDVKSLIFVVIGHKYWQIKHKFVVYDHQKETDYYLETKSQTSEWFGSEYKIAISYRHYFGKQLLTGLFKVIKF